MIASSVDASCSETIVSSFAVSSETFAVLVGGTSSVIVGLTDDDGDRGTASLSLASSTAFSIDASFSPPSLS